MPDLCSVLQWSLINRHLLGVQSLCRVAPTACATFEWVGGTANPPWRHRPTQIHDFRHFLLRAYHDWTPFFDFLKYASPTQCSTCTVKCTFRKCNAPFPSATVMSQLGVQSCCVCGDRQMLVLCSVLQCYRVLQKRKMAKFLFRKNQVFVRDC